MRLLLSLLLFCIPALAQFGNATRIQSVPVCSPLTLTDGFAIVYDTTSACFKTESVVAGGVAFSGVSGGTNTSAAMVVGTGASLTVSGSGTINSTSLGGVTAAASNVRTCEIVVGDPGAASPVLADDNDTPSVCGNKTGATLTITAVECYAATGSPTVTPIITGGGGTSILTGALTCGTGSFASGTLNGTPTQSNGGSIDGNITSAGGTAKYLVIRVTRTL